MRREHQPEDPARAGGGQLGDGVLDEGRRVLHPQRDPDVGAARFGQRPLDPRHLRARELQQRRAAADRLVPPAQLGEQLGSGGRPRRMWV